MVMIINPKANKPRPVAVDSSVDYSIENGFLYIKFCMRFTPFDLRKYRWTLFENKRVQAGEIVNSNNEKLNWLNCTLFNYIPFALVRAKTEGFFTSYESTRFDEVKNGWNLKSLDYIRHTIDFSDNATINNVIETDLKAKAVDRLGIQDDNPYWVRNDRGRALNFSYALNGNKFYSTDCPPDSTGFDYRIEKLCNGDVDETESNIIWKDGEINEVVISAQVNVSNDGQKRTYAVICANPVSYEIQTQFIHVSNVQPITRTRYEYVPGTFNFSGDVDNYVESNIEQLNDKAVKLIVNKQDSATNWSKFSSRVRFKIRKTVISE